jgi:hypothetical protein
MKMQLKIGLGIAIFTTLIVTGAVGQTQVKRNLYATTEDNRLATINLETSSSKTTKFMGLGNNETMIGIDFGPRDGKLYGISNQNRIYTIDPNTANTTAIGSSAFAPNLNGTAFGMDFNPTVNRI